MILTVDNVEYDVLVPAGGVKRSFDILDGKNAGRLTSGRMTRDITGTFYNYELQIYPKDWPLFQTMTVCMKCFPGSG